MTEEIKYSINLEEISSAFKFTESSLTHKQCSKFKLLPYDTNEKTLVSDFSGVLGSFSRMISNKDFEEEFNSDNFINEIVELIGEFEGNSSKEAFKDIIKTMFIDNKKLVDFDIKTINYISSSAVDEKISKFLYSVLFDDRLNKDVENLYNKEADNVLYKLALKALPDLKNKEYSINEYCCYLPFVRNLFIHDLKFILSNEELYKNSLKRLLEYYYMFYVSQLAMKLKSFEKADMSKADVLYYTLDWESTSKNRTAYQFGLEKLRGSVSSLFSHAITLEFLNYHNLGRQLGYIELFDEFKKADENLGSNINELIKEYMERRNKGIDWSNFKSNRDSSGNSTYDKIYELFDAIEFQFSKSTRGGSNNKYSNCFLKFIHSNFAKRRGQLGYNLNITEDDIILITKICINNNKKIKLKNLFDEFELRGLFFDRDSKTKIIQLYEKLNLLEKKSDSGDAQYVRSVL